jgi:hypothetical protein
MLNIFNLYILEVFSAIVLLEKQKCISLYYRKIFLFFYFFFFGN